MPYKDREKNLAYQRERNRKRYAENHKDELARLRENNRKRLAMLRSMVDDIKSVPCADCGGLFPPVCMDFDHTNGNKVANISKMVSDMRPVKVILDEISKCDIVCANCHRIRTQSRWRDEPVG